MDSVMSNALKRRDELQRELRDVERFLSLYERFKHETRQQPLPGFDNPAPPESEPAGRPIGSEPAEPPTDLPSALTGLNREQLRPYITKVLEDAGRPLTRGTLLQRLDRAGVQVGGTYDRSKNLGTIMWRLREYYKNFPGLGYWPSHLPYEPAGYEPEVG